MMDYIHFQGKKESLYKQQFGFRDNRSSTHALIEITEIIRKSCDNDSYSCADFLDLKKEFGTVNQFF